MHVLLQTIGRNPPQYAGLPMTAEEYFRLPDDGYRYEIVQGVMALSPSPSPKHQRVLVQIVTQIQSFLELHAVGNVYAELDIKLEERLVYRPDIVFIRAERVLENWERVRTAPDLVVEILSPESRRYDRETKRDDYERCGVREYWMVDPDDETFTFLRLEAGKYVEVAPEGEHFHSQTVPGFALDIAAVRRSFRPT
jgi:Uma2 family endonuclease